MPELIWSGKDDAKKSLLNIPTRLLDFDSSLSYGDDSQNIIVHGDNLSVLKSLLPLYRSAVKCIYIDPPYNTGSAFENYKDNFPHSDWLNLMLPRLILLKDFLADDGSIFIQIDDTEQAYLKILCDEIFGRNNFIANIIWRKKSGGGQDAEYFAIEHENILVYKKNDWRINDEFTAQNIEDFNSTINGKPAKLVKLEKWGTSAYREDRPSLYYPIKNPEGENFYPTAPNGKDGRWRKKPETLDENHIHWIKRGNKWTPYEVIYFDETQNKKIKTRSIWLDYGNSTDATNELKNLFGSKIFATPKPERLIQRILTLATNEGDMVLDAYLGSGTTAAVAHKMKRRYIGIEIGEQIITHVVPRLKKVIDGEVGGISKIENWQGGGGYKFYRLGEKITDETGTLNSAVTEKDLAALIWFKATKTPYRDEKTLPLIGVHNGAAYYLVENLTRGTFMNLPQHDGEKIIYGDACKVGENFLRENKITFKQIPKALEE